MQTVFEKQEYTSAQYNRKYDDAPLNHCPGGEANLKPNCHHYLQKRHLSSYQNSQIITMTALVVLLFRLDCSTLRAVSAFSIMQEKNFCDSKRIIFDTNGLSKTDKPLELLDQAYEKGFRRFHLAGTYDTGKSEPIFGEWLKSRDIDRDTINVIAKGGLGKENICSPTRPLLTQEGLFEEVKASLTALKTDVVDLYLFHHDDQRIPTSKFVLWANEIVELGYARAWGVSNWSFERFREAHDFAVKHNLILPTGNSPQFSLAIPQCSTSPATYSISGTEHVEQIEWYEENNIELLCQEVLAYGFMTKPNLWPQKESDLLLFHALAEEGEDDYGTGKMQQSYCHQENYRRRDIALELAQKCGCNLFQVATMYPLSMGEHISIILGPTKENHLDDIMNLKHLRLDDEALYHLAGATCKRDEEYRFSTSEREELGETLFGASNVQKFSRSRGSFPFGINSNVIETTESISSKESFRLYAA